MFPHSNPLLLHRIAVLLLPVLWKSKEKPAFGATVFATMSVAASMNPSRHQRVSAFVCL